MVTFDYIILILNSFTKNLLNKWKNFNILSQFGDDDHISITVHTIKFVKLPSENRYPSRQTIAIVELYFVCKEDELDEFDLLEIILLDNAKLAVGFPQSTPFLKIKQEFVEIQKE